MQPLQISDWNYKICLVEFSCSYSNIRFEAFLAAISSVSKRKQKLSCKGWSKEFKNDSKVKKNERKGQRDREKNSETKEKCKKRWKRAKNELKTSKKIDSFIYQPIFPYVNRFESLRGFFSERSISSALSKSHLYNLRNTRSEYRGGSKWSCLNNVAMHYC